VAWRALLEVGEVGGGQALQCHPGQRALGEAAADALAEHHGDVLVRQVRAPGHLLGEFLRAG
jgi:beta-glucosidase-like glycosyl hydrolase